MVNNQKDLDGFKKAYKKAGRFSLPAFPIPLQVIYS
jgi:hypothetical protein